jgi:glycosyltransferase involved in cell wall biosynthesis
LRIAVLNNCVPFVYGGAERLAEALTDRLRRYGHDPVLIRLPFHWHPAEKIIECMLACRLVRLPNVDRVVGLKFPAYYVPHDNKVLWLLHQFRQAYDMWGTPYQDIPDTDEGRRIRDAVVECDNRFLPEARFIHTLSHVTAERLKKFNALDSSPLFHPLPNPEQYWNDGYGDYIFFPSRINPGKRQYLVVEAMKHTRSSVKLVIAGAGDTAEYVEELHRIIEKNGVQDRVALVGAISEERKVALFRGALGCAYTPYDEDSYGYVTLEACHSRKPTITCTDSGGTRILVKDGVTGLVAEPDPQDIAGAMDSLFENRRRTRELGEAAHEYMRLLKISWDHVVERLTSP